MEQSKKCTKCTKCTRDVVLSGYYPDKKKLDGLQSWCKACVRARPRSENSGTRVCSGCRKRKPSEDFRHIRPDAIRCTPCADVVEAERRAREARRARAEMNRNTPACKSCGERSLRTTYPMVDGYRSLVCFGCVEERRITAEVAAGPKPRRVQAEVPLHIVDARRKRQLAKDFARLDANMAEVMGR